MLAQVRRKGDGREDDTDDDSADDKDDAVEQLFSKQPPGRGTTKAPA